MNPAFYLDNDVAPQLAVLLAAMGYIATTARTHGNAALLDESQVIYAPAHGWVVVTHNYRDLRRIHHEWRNDRRAHSGIVAVDQDAGRYDAEDYAGFMRELLTTPGIAFADQFHRWHRNRGWLLSLSP